MEQPRLIRLIEEHLLSMLGATIIVNSTPSTNRDQCVSFLDPSKIAIKADRNDEYRVVIARGQNFDFFEKTLVDKMVKEFNSIQQVTNSYRAEIESNISKRVIASYLDSRGILETIIDSFEAWAAQTYEGSRISASVGITDREIPNSKIAIRDFFKEEFSPVLSNGYDTILVCDSNGQIDRFECLDKPLESHSTPYRLNKIASWTKENKIAVVLNRHGEIIIYKNCKLLFAKRSGSWVFFSHESVIRSMKYPQRRELRNAIYESCLDVSFARSGGCIAVVRHDRSDNLQKHISTDDIISNLSNNKTRVLSRAIGSNFQYLDRRIRQELLSLDGALIMKHTGQIIATGAIVEIASGSRGGGRYAAAKSLSSLGLGIKISEDGGIIGFMNQIEVFKI